MSAIAPPSVAPLVGAWIEIAFLTASFVLSIVAPLVGAWIEISVKINALIRISVAPLVGAWIEIAAPPYISFNSMESLLSWERGLKYNHSLCKIFCYKSLLSWERGLKYGIKAVT